MAVGEAWRRWKDRDALRPGRSGRRGVSVLNGLGVSGVGFRRDGRSLAGGGASGLFSFPIMRVGRPRRGLGISNWSPRALGMVGSVRRQGAVGAARWERRGDASVPVGRRDQGVLGSVKGPMEGRCTSFAKGAAGGAAIVEAEGRGARTASATGDGTRGSEADRRGRRGYWEGRPRAGPAAHWGGSDAPGGCSIGSPSSSS